MIRRDIRSSLAPRKVSGRRATRSLLGLVGRALGDRAARTLEKLEPRQLLDGSFDSPIVLPGPNADGRIDQAGAIDPVVASSDDDTYSFIAPASNFITVLADTANQSPASSLNTRVQVFNNSRQLVTEGTQNTALSSGVRPDGWAGFVASAGERYFVKVLSDGPTPAGTYTLRVRTGNSTFDIGNDNPETGIAREAGSDPLLEPVRPILGQLGGTGPIANRLRQDEILYRWTVPSGDQWNSLVTVNVQSTADPSGTQRLDTHLEIYNAQGVLINNAVTDRDAGRLNDAFSVFKATPGATYFFRVRSDEVTNANIEVATGPFFVVMDALPTEFNLNPVTRRATLINEGFASFNVSSQVPSPSVPFPEFQTTMYSFVAGGSGLAFATVLPAGFAPVSDPAVAIYDSAGTRVAFNDNFFPPIPRIEAQLVGGQTYYLIVDGFALGNGSQYSVLVESNHTILDATIPPLPEPSSFDDHADIGDVDLFPELTDAQRREVGAATALGWGDPFLVTDPDGNWRRDVGLRVSANSTGRLHGSGDRDLFKFTAPTDTLDEYDGDNDDAGTALYVGGAFDVGNVGSTFPTRSRALTIWDADDFWYTGRQFADAAAGITWGFQDNPATDTVGPEVYAIYSWDLTPDDDTDSPFLVVGGDFRLIVPDNFGAPVQMDNFAVWAVPDGGGRGSWLPIADGANGPVYSISDGVFNGNSILAVGGSFSTLWGSNADNLAISINGNAFRQPTSTAEPNNAVRSVKFFEPFDSAATSQGLRLFVGGDFTAVTGLAGPAVNHAHLSSLLVESNLGATTFTWTAIGSGGTNGPVFAMEVFQPGDTDPTPSSADSILIGGNFTSVGGVPASSLARIGTNAAGSLITTNLALGGGTVYAITVWNPPNTNPPGPGTGTELARRAVIGGSFGSGDNANLAEYDGFILQDGVFGVGTDGPVFALDAYLEEQEPDVADTLDGTAPQEVLVIGGRFESFAGLARHNLAGISARTDVAVNDDFFIANNFNSGVGFENSAAGPGTVYALADYDDGNPGEWDRHDRPAPTLEIRVDTVEPAFPMDFFVPFGLDDLGVRVYDSNFNPLYTNNRIFTTPTPQAANPKGSFDAQLVEPADTTINEQPNFARTVQNSAAWNIDLDDVNSNAKGLTLWGGQTYYIEVFSINDSTGRYTLNVTTAAGPRDFDGDGDAEDINAVVAVEEGTGGDVASALQIDSNLFSGDGTSRAASTVLLGSPPFVRGNSRIQIRTRPSQGTFQTYGSDHGMISSLDDTDLYWFRAEFTGTTEIRISTRDIPDEYGIRTINHLTGLPTAFAPRDARIAPDGPYQSNLDAALRVFSNDLEQIAYSDNNPAFRPSGDDGGDRDDRAVGGNTARFEYRDPRAVIHVVAGNIYFFQVESGQRYAVGAPALPADRVENIPRETDFGRAIGSYRILLHQMVQLASDIENGVSKLDDFSNFRNTAAAVLPINEDPDSTSNGRGSINGVVDNTPLNADDVDVFRVIAPASGNMTVRLTRQAGSSLAGEVSVFDASTGSVITSASGGGATPIVTTASVSRGDEFYIVVGGQGASEGAYSLEVSGMPFADDHADASNWANATDVRLLDFQGVGTANGVIEFQGDTDVFRFQATEYDQFAIDVTATSPTLNPLVTVYEVTENDLGEPVFLRIGVNDDVNPGNGQAAGRDSHVLVSVSPERRIDVPDPGEDREYPFYYVVVSASNPKSDFGSYTLNITFTPSDDHPDGDTDGDDIFDTGDFPVATPVVLDSITGAGVQTGVIEEGVTKDTDLFKVTIPATGQVTITVSRPVGSLIRPRVTVLDLDGNLLSQGAGEDDAIFFEAGADFPGSREQTVFIVVEGFEGATPNLNTTTTGAYTLSVQAPPVDDHPNATEWNLATEVFLNPGDGVGRVGGDTGGLVGNPAIQPDNDTDLFRFTVLATGAVQVTITPFNTALGQIAPILSIFASTDLVTPIATVFASGPGAAATFLIPAATATIGTVFFILVDANEAAPLATSTGEYNLIIDGEGSGGPGNGGPDPGAIDFNNPTVVILNSRSGDGSNIGRTSNGQSPEINPSGDRDLYSFRTVAPGRVFVRISTTTGSLLDASVEVLRQNADGSRTQVAFDADGAAGSTSYTSFGAGAGQDYFVIVDGLGDSVGSYVVEIDTQPLVNRLYYPEGYTSDTVFEFIPIVNPNPYPVGFSVRLKYADGGADTVFPNLFMPPNTRDGVTITEGTISRGAGVRADVPYSIVVEWDAPSFDSLTGETYVLDPQTGNRIIIDPFDVEPLGATISHYDFNAASGDGLTSRVSNRWIFPRVERDPGVVLDFVLFYNPHAYDVDVTLNAYFPDGALIQLSEVRHVGANRREGYGINDFPELGRGIFSVVLDAVPAANVTQAQLDAEPFEGIVASLTHYRTLGDASAFTVIGDPDGGTTRGFSTIVGNSSTTASDVVFFNPGNSPTTVTLTGSYIRASLPNIPARTFQVLPGRNQIFRASDLGVLAGQPLAIQYSATGPISMLASEIQRGDADSSSPQTTAGANYSFGDAFINIDQAGRLYFETLFIFNPTGLTSNVSITLFFFDRLASRGETEQAVIDVIVPARGFAEVRLHERTEVLSNPRRADDGSGTVVSPNTWFGIDASSSQPFQITLQHYDLFLGGGWAAAGVPFGILTPISSIG